MKLTKEIVNKLKSCGMITATTPTEKFLESFKTVEEIADRGLVASYDYKAYLTEFLNEEEKEDITPEIITPEPIEPTVIETEEFVLSDSSEDITLDPNPKQETLSEQPTEEPTEELVETPDVETFSPASEDKEEAPADLSEELVAEQETPAEEPVVEKPKKTTTKKTTAKKTTKKES